MPDNDAYRGAQTVETTGAEHNALDFIVRQVLARVWTATIVLVKAVHPSTQTVDVQPMVAQLTGDGQAMPHGTIYAAPFLRLQAGGSAVILDPVVGDIGIGLFASHDTSAVRASGAPAAPGSRRRFDPADCMYVGGLLNGAAVRFLRMSAAGGLELVDPALVTITAAEVTVNGHLTVTGDARIDGRSFIAHQHTGVTAGGGVSGAPV